MKVKDFNTIRKMVRSYMATLNLDDCKAEMIEKGVLTSNAKLKKGDNANFGLELLPSVLSGANLCPSAGKCKLTCLAFSGVGNILKGKKMIAGTELSAPLKAKARRTFVFLNDKDWFTELLKSEITHKNAMAKLGGQKVYFRLNVTSDVDWRFLTDQLTEINFFDYTKVWTRSSTANYFITFSASELTTNEMIADKVSQGENVAVVFNSKKLPKDFLNFEVINGDKNDNRYDDPKGVIVGLVLKTTVGGKESTDFVREVA